MDEKKFQARRKMLDMLKGQMKDHKAKAHEAFLPDEKKKLFGVQIAADSKEGLAEGVDKAKEVIAEKLKADSDSKAEDAEEAMEDPAEEATETPDAESAEEHAELEGMSKEDLDMQINTL